MKNKTHYSLLTVGRSIFVLGAIALTSCTLTSASSGNTSCGARAQSIEPLLEETERLLEENQQFQALVSITRAGSMLIDIHSECESLVERLYELTIKSAYNLRGYNLLRTRDRLFLELSPNGNLLASYSFTGIQLWQTDGLLAATWNLQELSSNISDLSFSPDSSLIAVGGRSRASLIDINESKIENFESVAEVVDEIFFSPDGQSVVGFNNQTLMPGLQGGHVEIWKIEDGYLSDRFVGGADYKVLSGHFTLSELVIAVARYHPDRIGIELIDIDNNHLINLTDIEHFQDLGVNRFVFSPNSNFIAVGSDAGIIDLRTFTGQSIAILENYIPSNPYLIRHPLLHLKFSPDSQLLAAVTFGRLLKVWRVDASQLANISLIDEEEYEGNWADGFIGTMEFSPDGQTIFFGDPNGSIRLWTVDGIPLLNLDGHQSSVLDLQFSSDAQTLFSLDYKGNIIFWKPYDPLLINASDVIDIPEMTYDELLGLSCNWLQDYLASSPDLSEGDRRMCDWQNP
ncbi:WD40 repeat domain-containing protein [Synechococcus sp. PCC 7336]|uniref:WD40 repeat domain-containing protein n=1 Tax=Synechococcus sp. PCC 7336 TaxID=195250 RepID=UPI000348DCFE|nr:hypothetical protein [Synechococcus sp. PCC 7336]